jgi:hypothetical protein
MAITIISLPTGRCLSGNLPKIRLSADEDVRIRLMAGDKTLIDETYTPDFTDAINLDLSELVRDALSFTMPTGDVFVQPALVRPFTLLLNDDSHEFTAIRAGVKDLTGTPEVFLKQHFLTAQEQVKDVTAGQPEWLTYYATQEVYLYMAAYAPGQPAEYIKIATLEMGKACSVNMQFNRLAALCTHYPERIAAYVVADDDPSGRRWSRIQYYKLIGTSAHQFFGFENSLGGFDTVRCTGEAKTLPEYTPATATINDRESVYRVDRKDARSQNTGWLSKEATQWLQDLFASRKTYQYNNGEWESIVLDENPTAETSTLEDLTAFEFTYRPAVNKIYASLNKIDKFFIATWIDFINIFEDIYHSFSEGFANGFEI